MLPSARRLLEPFMLVAAGAVLGLLVSGFVSQIAAFGHFIPSMHIEADYFVALLWFLGVGVNLALLPGAFEERKDLLILWGVRGGVTLVAMLFYENHYSVDAYDYYFQSLPPSFNWSLVSFGGGTENTQAFSWLINHALPIFDSYHALKVFYSLIGFAACFTIYRAFKPFCEVHRRKLLYLVFLFPSIIFWSSIIGKDPVILFGVALYTYGTVRFAYGMRPIYLLPMAAGVLVASFFRSWYLPILVLPLASLGFRGIKRPALRVAFLILIAASSVAAFKVFAEKFELGSMDDVLDRTQSVSHSWSRGGSALVAPDLGSVSGMLKFAPVGMFTALFRPLPGEVMNPFGLLAGLENLSVLGFIALHLRRILRDRERLREPLTAWALTLLLVWSFIYGFVSYQNLGAAVRFKLQILPVLVCLLFFLTADRPDEEPI